MKQKTAYLALLLLLLCFGRPLEAQSSSPISSLAGDANGDASVDILDVQLVINLALGLPGAMGQVDVNRDGRVDVLDVQLTINLALDIPTLIALIPDSGPIGATVVLEGGAFDDDATNNLVSFGSTSAVVTRVFTLSGRNVGLELTVPAGLSIGAAVPVTVTVNGRSTAPLSFLVLAQGIADLAVTRFTVASSAAIGDQFRAPSIELRNLGSASAGAHLVAISFSTLGTPSNLDPQCDLFFIANLPAGAALDETTISDLGFRTVTAGRMPGSVILGAIVDPLDQVVELDEVNNIRASSSGPTLYSDVALAELTPVGFMTGPANGIDPNTSFTVFVPLGNLGPVDTGDFDTFVVFEDSVGTVFPLGPLLVSGGLPGRFIGTLQVDLTVAGGLFVPGPLTISVIIDVDASLDPANGAISENRDDNNTQSEIFIFNGP